MCIIISFLQVGKLRLRVKRFNIGAAVIKSGRSILVPCPQKQLCHINLSSSILKLGALTVPTGYPTVISPLATYPPYSSLFPRLTNNTLCDIISDAWLSSRHCSKYCIFLV